MAKIIEKVIAGIMAFGMLSAVMVPMKAQAAAYIDENGVYESIMYDYELNQIVHVRKDKNITETTTKDFKHGKVYVTVSDENHPELGSAVSMERLTLDEIRWWYVDVKPHYADVA